MDVNSWIGARSRLNSNPIGDTKQQLNPHIFPLSNFLLKSTLLLFIWSWFCISFFFFEEHNHLSIWLPCKFFTCSDVTSDSLFCSRTCCRCWCRWRALVNVPLSCSFTFLLKINKGPLLQSQTMLPSINATWPCPSFFLEFLPVLSIFVLWVEF